LVWEGYWAYVFATAPNPDEKMDTVFALLMAVFLPLLIAAAAGLIVLGKRLGQG
jgi:mannitol-specific phosphotransferase system IIBC component